MLKKIVKKPLKLKRSMAVILSLGIIVGSLSILSFIKRSQTSQATSLQIQSVFPRIGTPAGGDKVRIRGKDFQSKDSFQLTQISGGYTHTCVLDSANKAYCWGYNYAGALGNNSTTEARTPVAVHQGEIPAGVTLTQISAGDDYTCALGSNSKVYCWGEGEGGRLGNNSTADALTPVAVHQGEIPNNVTITHLSVGYSHACVFGSDSRTYCWGKGSYGKLGNNSTSNALTPVTIHQGEIPAGVTLTQISAGEGYTCALGSNSKVYCWGKGEYLGAGRDSSFRALTPIAIHQGQIPNGVTVMRMVAGIYHTCVIGSNSKAYCWGAGYQGQLGNGLKNISSTPVAVRNGEIPSGITISQIMMGIYNTCAIASDLKTYCWGRNFEGQLGNNTYGNDSATPVAVHSGEIPSGVRIAKFPSVNVGGYQICALGSDAKAYCWGDAGGSSGRLGNNSTSNSPAPVAVHQGQIPAGTQVKVDGNPVPVKYISPYELEITMSGHSAGKVNITVTNPDNTTHTLSQAYEYYQPQNPTITSITPMTGLVAGNTQLTVSGNHLDPMRWKSVHSGSRHTCALSYDAKAYCWGRSSNGELGNNTTTNALTPVAVHQGQIPNDAVLTQVSAGQDHTCALGSNGKAYCWGKGEDGRLGNNTTANALTPVAVHQGQIPAGVSLTQITTGGAHTCALGSDAKAYCWGYNNHGQLGNNATTDALTPVAVQQGQIPAGVSLTQIVTVGIHTCALGSDAKAYCWGWGNFGQLGNNSTTDTSTPIRVHDHLYSITAGTANATNTTTLKNIQLSTTNPNQLTFTIPPATQANSTAPAPHAGTIPVSITHQLTNKTTNTLNYTYYTTPPAPTNLTTTTTLPLSSITLSFKSPSTAGLDNQANAGNNYSAITDYRIDYCLANSAGTACQDPTNTTPTITNPTNWLTHTHTPLVSTSTSPLSLTIPNLTKPGKYLFRVAAINQAGLGTYAQSIATLASYVSLQTSPTLGINLTPLHNQTYSSNKLTLISSSNLTAGHKLTMTSTTTNNQLTHTTIPANTISSTTHSFTSPNTLTPNTWGFYIPNTTTNQQHNTISYTQFSNQDTTYTNQSNPNLKHAQIPTTPLTIANYNQPLTNQPLNLIFGINISNTQPSGNYQATMKFEVVGN